MKSKFSALILSIAGFLLLALNFSCSEINVLSQKTENGNNNFQMNNTEPTNTNQKDKFDIKPKNPNAILLTPSTILDDLENYKKNNPQISAKELVDFGNTLLPQKGFNFDIDVADLVENKIKSKETTNISDKNDPFPFITFLHKLTLNDGTKKTFQIIAPEESNCCCGYQYAEFPVLNIIKNQMTLVADGKYFVVQRTKELSMSEEYSLVDNETMLKVIRNWQVPGEGAPLGISDDGKKLYISVTDELALEIAEDGNFRFIDSIQIKSGEGVYIKNHPKDKTNDYLAFKRFKIGNKSYTIKFSGPCT